MRLYLKSWIRVITKLPNSDFSRHSLDSSSKYQWHREKKVETPANLRFTASEYSFDIIVPRKYCAKTFLIFYCQSSSEQKILEIAAMFQLGVSVASIEYIQIIQMSLMSTVTWIQMVADGRWVDVKENLYSDRSSITQISTKRTITSFIISLNT